MTRADLAKHLRDHWQAGDALAAAALTGTPYPSAQLPEGLDADQGLAFLISDARAFIAELVRGMDL